MEITILPEPRPDPPLRAALEALRRHLQAFLLIQASAVALVVAYRASEPVRALCASLVQVRQAGGLPFAALASAVAGGVLPELAMLVTRGGRGGGGSGGGGVAITWRRRAGAVAFNVAFFALNGVVIDLFYRLSASLFGATATPGVVAAKVAFDQLVFSPLWLSVIAALFAWQRYGFRVAATRAELARGFLRRRLLPLLVPNLCFWIPMTSIIYALPVPLQFLLFVLALAAWSLIMVFIAAR